MAIRQAFVMALKSLLARKVRSLLTMLGIIIGVAAVIAIITIGRGTMEIGRASCRVLWLRLRLSLTIWELI